MINSMEMVNKYGLMVQHFKDNTWMVKKKEKVNLFGQMDHIIKVNFRIIR